MTAATRRARPGKRPASTLPATSAKNTSGCCQPDSPKNASPSRLCQGLYVGERLNSADSITASGKNRLT
jgi:hypothetical protein